MITYSLPNQAPSIPNHPRSVALGLFDGLHIGHIAVITAAVKAGGGAAAVYTFRPDTLTTKTGLQRLTTDEERQELMEHIGVTELFEAEFTNVRQLSPEEFVQKILHEQLHAAAVCCGYNYRFGQGGRGDVHTLQKLCTPLGIHVTVVPAITASGQEISSTAIRSAIADGDMDTARRLLGHSYCLKLPVIAGQQLGRRLGIPTINQHLREDMTCPRHGVYASCVEIGDKTYTGVTNIGRRPTVGSDAVLAETFIHDFTGDLYGQRINVYPLHWLRGEKKFDTLEALRWQVQQDSINAKAFFAPSAEQKIQAVLFDFDDTVHRRRPAFTQAIFDFLHRQYPNISEPERQRRAASMLLGRASGYPALDYLAFIREFLNCWEEKPTISPEIAMGQFFMDFAAAVQLEPDVAVTLTALRQEGIKLGVITNGFSVLQNAKVTLSGLRELIDLTVVSKDEDLYKPDVALFKRAAARLGVPCENCLFVGDHPINDIAGAQAAGMQTVRIDLGISADYPEAATPVPEDTPTIHQLKELLPLLGKNART